METASQGTTTISLIYIDFGLIDEQEIKRLNSK